MNRFARGVAIAVLAFAFGGASIVSWLLFAPLPDHSGTYVLPSLAEKALVKFDHYGVPHIEARDRADAFGALGYVTARDRFFQMDLLRRKPAGRLAEIFGEATVEEDRWARMMGFSRLAKAVHARLPEAHKAALSAYAAGVNQALLDARALPWEFALLGYRPEPWRVEDSILVMFNLARLSYTEEQERMASVMHASLPDDVFRFLTPDSDCFNEPLAASGDPDRCTSFAPVESLARLVAEAEPGQGAALTAPHVVAQGSNAWVVGRPKTRSGGAIIANDMHLSLSLPNIWYQADIAYGDSRMEGVTLPGVPMIVAGSNGHVSWGLTSVDGDFADLVRLRRTGQQGDKYEIPDGEAAIFSRRERIYIRGNARIDLIVRETIWGPMLDTPLLGSDVAVRWTMLDPQATNLNMMDMDRVQNVAAALPVLQGAGVPPLNGLIADDMGRIAWTLMGKIPKRRGMEGLIAENWNDSRIGWDGYLSPEEIPAIVDPPQGFIVSANHRMIAASKFTPKLSQDFPGGFRARRIHDHLSAAERVGVEDMAALQIDADASFYRFYGELARATLREHSIATPEASRMRSALDAWDGRAEPDSLGFPMVVAFRAKLIERIFRPILSKCRQRDPSFTYEWSNVDVPLQAIIRSGDPRLVPQHAAGKGWQDFLSDALAESARDLEITYARPIDQLRWGDVNVATIAHPLSRAAPLLSHILDMPAVPLGGCTNCVRVNSNEGGASVGANVRMALSPGKESEGLLQMAGGQSGQLASRHYGDREKDWVSGRSEPFRAKDTQSEITLVPAAR